MKSLCCRRASDAGRDEDESEWMGMGWEGGVMVSRSDWRVRRSGGLR